MRSPIGENPSVQIAAVPEGNAFYWRGFDRRKRPTIASFNQMSPRWVALNSSLPNVPHATGAELFLIGSNDARALQDAGTTNKGEMKPDGTRFQQAAQCRQVIRGRCRDNMKQGPA